MTNHQYDPTATESWGWMDSRTRKKVSITTCRTREQAERRLADWRERDERGGRTDLHDLMPHVVVVNLDHCRGILVGKTIPLAEDSNA